jgi:adenylate cyclase
MPAILPGYEYDIFISYRQNDNKRDAWVTQFVQVLRDELEATLKNPVSIYFDENPHDGLLESHQVGASLEKKLKCLVIIPIISQTYCDPKCFAWEHEFLPFIQMAKADDLGMNITIANGNVASRVLPIKIHDLDIADEQLLSETLGGPLRSIDFIYKEPGVNRPLKVDDTKKDNLNKTNYHNQINKVANALKELGTAMLSANGSEDGVIKKPTKAPKLAAAARSNSPKKKRPVLIISLLLIAAFSVGYYFIWGKNQGKSNIDSLDKSIAVMAFKNMSNDPDQEYFSDGISEEIINAMVNIEGLKVAGRTSSFSFKGKNEDLRVIAEKLDVAMILEGSVRKSGDQLRITAQLINAETGFNLWSNTFEGNITDIFKVQDEISQSVVDKLKITLLHNEDIDKSEKYRPKQEAYDLYLKGTYHWNRRGKDLFKALDYYSEAIAIDSGYAQAHAGLAQTYVLLGFYEMRPALEVYPLAKISADKALSIDENSVEALAALGFYYLYYKWDTDKSYNSFKLALKANYYYTPAHYWYNNLLRQTGRFEEAIKEAEIAIELEPLAQISHIVHSAGYIKLGDAENALQSAKRAHEINPFLLSYNSMASALMILEQYEETKSLLKEGAKLLERPPMLLVRLVELNMITGDTLEAHKIMDELELRKQTEFISYVELARCAWAVGRENEAIEYYNKAILAKSTQLINYQGFRLYSSISPKLTFIDDALNIRKE